MTTGEFIFLLTGTSLATFLPRYLPIIFLARRELSPAIKRWMSYIPVSIFAALVAQDAFFIEAGFELNPLVNVKIIPTILTFIVAVLTKSLLWSVITGIVSMVAMGIFI